MYTIFTIHHSYPSMRMRCLNNNNFVHKVLSLTEGDLKNIHFIGKEDHQDNLGWTAASLTCQPILTPTIWPEISNIK